MRADARRNQEQLMRAAAAAFAERGADDVALEEIARRAGVGIGTLYRHFPTRQALLEAVYLDQVETLRAEADHLLGASSPGEALFTWLRSLIAFSSTKRNLSAALMADLGKDSELFSACSRMLREAATELLTRAQQAGVVRADATAADLVRLVHAVSMASEWSPTDRGQADRLLAVVFDGLRQGAASAGQAAPGNGVRHARRRDGASGPRAGRAPR